MHSDASDVLVLHLRGERVWEVCVPADIPTPLRRGANANTNANANANSGAGDSKSRSTPTAQRAALDQMYTAARFDQVKFNKIESARLSRLVSAVDRAADDDDDSINTATDGADDGMDAPIDLGGSQYDGIDFNEYACTNVTLTAGDRLYLPYVM